MESKDLGGGGYTMSTLHLLSVYEALRDRYACVCLGVCAVGECVCACVQECGLFLYCTCTCNIIIKWRNRDWGIKIRHHIEDMTLLWKIYRSKEKLNIRAKLN